MSSNPDNTVSVVIPCYNGAAYVAQALDSARTQTHRPCEIIVVDDGSTDDSARRVADYAVQHPDTNVRLVQQENAGEPAARNRGIREASGKWVAALDTDDWWEPPKLELQLQAAAEQGDDCVLVHTGVFYNYPDGRELAKPLGEPARRVGRCTKQLLEPTSIGHPSIMVRRDALEQIGGYDEAFRQSCDIDLYFRLSAVGTFAFVPKHLLHYRLHEKQMSSSQVDQIPFHHRAVRKFFVEHPEIEEQIGRETIGEALADHVAVKLESLWWKRQLVDFRKLLDYAADQQLDSGRISYWRRRSKWPNWLIRLRDSFGAA